MGICNTKCGAAANNNLNKKAFNTMAKRQWRNDMPKQQRDRIAAANKGKKLSPQTRALISKKLEKYWASLPTKPASNTGNTSTGGAIYPPGNNEE